MPAGQVPPAAADNVVVVTTCPASLHEGTRVPGAAAATRARADAPPELASALLADNLRRVRWMGLAMPLLNLLYLLLLAHTTLDGTPHTLRWQEALRHLHLAMAPVFALAGLGAHWLLHTDTAPGVLHRAWPPLIAAVALGFALGFVAIDQWVGSNVAAFLLGCIIVGVVVGLSPWVSTLLYSTALVAFWAVMGALQQDPVALLANQLNGTTGAVLGWVLALLNWRQQRQNKQLTLELQQAATVDSLTGLANRLEAVRLINEELGRGRRHGHATSLLLLDLDHFKQVNDRLGHPGGDRVLQQTAAVLAQAVRAHDRVGRLGGEEFIVLLPQTDALAARHLAERLRQRLAKGLWQDGEITCSIGVVTARAEHEIGFDQLYLRADQALYRAKSAGRNRCEAAA